MAVRTNTGTVAITGDNGQTVSFSFNNATYAIGYGQEPGSWFETLKYAHRNRANISVTDDDTVTKYSVNNALAFIPTDLHDA